VANVPAAENRASGFPIANGLLTRHNQRHDGKRKYLGIDFVYATRLKNCSRGIFSLARGRDHSAGGFLRCRLRKSPQWAGFTYFAIGPLLWIHGSYFGKRIRLLAERLSSAP
jgi:hypothetical protein